MTSILVVDDDRNNQRILSFTLRNAGYEVQIASDGETGLESLREAAVDLAIIDYTMPIMDGLMMVKLMKQEKELADIPIIILTASGDDSLRISAQKIGVHGFLTKPSSSESILETVANILKIT